MDLSIEGFRAPGERRSGKHDQAVALDAENAMEEIGAGTIRRVFGGGFESRSAGALCESNGQRRQRGRGLLGDPDLCFRDVEGTGGQVAGKRAGRDGRRFRMVATGGDGPWVKQERARDGRAEYDQGRIYKDKRDCADSQAYHASIFAYASARSTTAGSVLKLR